MVPNPETGELIRTLTEPRVGRIIGFEESNSLNQKGRSDYAWTLQKGDRASGDVVTRYVQEFLVPEPEDSFWIKNIATVVVFGDSDAPDWEATIEKAFAAQGYTLANLNVRQLPEPPLVLPRWASAPALGASDADNDLPF